MAVATAAGLTGYSYCSSHAGMHRNQLDASVVLLSLVRPRNVIDQFVYLHMNQDAVDHVALLSHANIDGTSACPRLRRQDYLDLFAYRGGAWVKTFDSTESVLRVLESATSCPGFDPSIEGVRALDFAANRREQLAFAVRRLGMLPLAPALEVITDENGTYRRQEYEILGARYEGRISWPGGSMKPPRVALGDLTMKDRVSLQLP